jgi:hypothetical protein
MGEPELTGLVVQGSIKAHVRLHQQHGLLGEDQDRGEDGEHGPVSAQGLQDHERIESVSVPASLLSCQFEIFEAVHVLTTTA